MSNQRSDNDWEELASCNPEPVPAEVSTKILSRAKQVLDPRLASLSLRLFIIHVFASSLTLIFCPQFGIGPLGGDMGWMSFVMALDPWVCSLVCGSIFLGSTSLACQFLLRPEELRKLLRHGVWLFPVVGGVSLGLLMLFSAEFSGLFLTLVWGFGGSLIAVLSLQLGWLFRWRILRRINFRLGSPNKPS